MISALAAASCASAAVIALTTGHPVGAVLFAIAAIGFVLVDVDWAGKR